MTKSTRQTTVRKADWKGWPTVHLATVKRGLIKRGPENELWEYVTASRYTVTVKQA